MDFVVGHPRSGTAWVSHLLQAAAPGVAGHELLFDRAWDAVWVPSEYYAGRVDATMVRRLLDAYRGTSARIDCNWKLTWLLPVLLDTFPGARVVHLVRAPAANVRSCLELDYYGPLVDDPRFQGDDEPTRRRNYWLRWMPRVRRPDWDALDQAERNCAFWTETHRLVLEVAPALGPRYHRVHLEQLTRPAVVADLARFLEVPAPSEEALEAVRAAQVNDKDHEKALVRALREVPPLSPAVVERMCGAMARALGEPA